MYGIDSISTWSCLLAIIPSEYVEMIECCQIPGGFLGQPRVWYLILLQVEYICTGVYHGLAVELVDRGFTHYPVGDYLLQ